MDFDHLHHLFNYYHDSSYSSVDILLSEFEKQRLDMDCFIQLQSMRLRRAILEEQGRIQAITMQQYAPLIEQKDEEIAIAKSRRRNLEDLLKGAEMEARGWEKAAREGEAIVSDLNKRLNAVSFSSSSSSSKGERKMGGCKKCSNGRACVVMLPCRHLCCCKLCEPFLEHCPLCHTIKNSTFQAFFT